MIRLREARAKDIIKFTRFAVPRQYVGYVAEEDGEAVGLAVIMYGALDRFWLTLDTTEKLRQKPFLLHRVAKNLVKLGVSAGDLYAVQDHKEPTSEQWLTRLGFRDTGEVFEGERVFRWHQ